jgi:hypothetical protein
MLGPVDAQAGALGTDGRPSSTHDREPSFEALLLGSKALLLLAGVPSPLPAHVSAESRGHALGDEALATVLAGDQACEHGYILAYRRTLGG